MSSAAPHILRKSSISIPITGVVGRGVFVGFGCGVRMGSGIVAVLVAVLVIAGSGFWVRMQFT